MKRRMENMSNQAVEFIGTKEMRLLNHYVAEKSTVIGLLVEGKLVGYVEYHDDGDNALFIDMISVYAEHQRNGYATLLLDKLVETHPNTVAFTGESTAMAVSYWESKGAVFEPDTFKQFEAIDRPISEDEIEFEGLNIPFHLEVQKGAVPFWMAS